MRQRQTNWKMIYYSGSQHTFTNPAVDKHALNGAKNNQIAAERSWKAMQGFLDQVFN